MKDPQGPIDLEHGFHVTYFHVQLVQQFRPDWQGLGAPHHYRLVRAGRPSGVTHGANRADSLLVSGNLTDTLFAVRVPYDQLSSLSASPDEDVADLLEARDRLARAVLQHRAFLLVHLPVPIHVIPLEDGAVVGARPNLGVASAVPSQVDLNGTHDGAVVVRAVRNKHGVLVPDLHHEVNAARENLCDSGSRYFDHTEDLCGVRDNFRYSLQSLGVVDVDFSLAAGYPEQVSHAEHGVHDVRALVRIEKRVKLATLPVPVQDVSLLVRGEDSLRLRVIGDRLDSTKVRALRVCDGCPLKGVLQDWRGFVNIRTFPPVEDCRPA